MKNHRKVIMGVSMLLLTASPAFAIDTSKTYNSGILTGIFLAFCALIVVVQLMPTIMLLIGFVKSLVKRTDHKAARDTGKG